MSKIDYEKYSQIFKALAHPIRLQIVDVLLDGECCVNDVVNAIGISQSTSSQHLAILKNSGIVYPERHGTKICYKVKSELAREVVSIIKRNNNT